MKLLAIIVLLFLIGACSPSRFVEPLAEKEWAVGGDFGGPVIDFGAPIPVPITQIEVGYGLKEDLTLHGGLHTTAMLFGNAQIDLGCTYQYLQQDGLIPSLSVSPAFNYIYAPSTGKMKLWPMLDANAFWNYGQRRNYFYVGVNNYFELSSTQANYQPQGQHVLVNPQFGHLLKSKSGKWQFTTEVKLLAPYLNSSYVFVPYKPAFSNYGAIGFYLGLRRLLHGGKRDKE